MLVSAVLSQTVYAWETVEYSDVTLGTDVLFHVTNSAFKSSSERAEEINERIKRVFSDPSVDASTFQIHAGLDGNPTLMLDSRLLCTVHPLDAQSYGTTQQMLAQRWLERLQQEFQQYRREQSKALAETRPGKKNTSLGQHAVLLLFLEIGVLLFASLLFGELFVRLGQPAIIGQIMAGIVLGQTVFGNLFPSASELIFPQDGSQTRHIEVVSWIGVSFLLMLTGMESDFTMLKRLGKPALYLTVIGLLGPLLAGGVTSLALPRQLLGDEHLKLALAVLLGAVFSASSVAVVAKILMDMKLLKRDIGQLALGVSLSHDLLCCLLLSAVAILSGKGSNGGNLILITLAGTAGFLLVMYFGRPLFFAILRWVNDKISTSEGLITAMAVLLLFCAATTEALGLHVVLGAFAAGVILSQAPVVNRKVVRPLEIVTLGFFAPIFFASAGLNVNLVCLLKPELAAVTLALLLVAILSKLGACYLAGRLAGLGTWESVSIGLGANARGSMGLILAMLGYTLNIISLDMLAVVIFIAVASTALTPPLMKWALAKIQVTDEERQRAEKEERRAQTILSSIRRVLWPTSGKGRSRFIGKLLDSIGERQVVETTALWVKQPGSTNGTPFSSIAQAINKQRVMLSRRTVKSQDPIKSIVSESNRGYDLLVMATDKPDANDTHVFGDIVDTVILNTSTRVLVVYEPEQTGEQQIRKVLVPVSSSDISVIAGEFGITLARSLGAHVTWLIISAEESKSLYSDKTRSGEKLEVRSSDEISNRLSELSKALDVGFEPVLVHTSAHPAEAIVFEAQRRNIDLIVLGAERKLSKGLFLGHTVNFVLRHAPCTVAVLKLRG
jgi:Kef-type K+ transport system membrane component KefB/nucleotide-binding universal stress UspA family protein